ncbi:MAG: class I SAM-dependent methyltransferase, partial [Nanoarchaeota archaeon]
SFWDSSGILHWGLFQDDEDIVSASNNLTNDMIEKTKISESSNVLNIGCGNGEVDVQTVKKIGCKITGIDLSGVRIENAKKKITQKLKNKLNFIHTSATNLPFDDGAFSHVISQSTIYHVHNKQKALSEIYRVLQRGGIFVFDDLVKPKPNVSRDTQKFVYERLLFDTPFSFKTYQEELRKHGFEVIEARDETKNMKKTYQKLCRILEEKIKNNENPKFHERYQYLIKAYKKTIKATNKNEIGWVIFVCKKPK